MLQFVVFSAAVPKHIVENRSIYKNEGGRKIY